MSDPGEGFSNLRRSGRVKKPTSFHTTSLLSELKWTRKEKEFLLEGIRKHGMKDPKLLSTEVLNGSKTASQVATFLASEKRRYQKEMDKASQRVRAPIDNWISTMSRSHVDPGAIFASMFSLIAQYEEHPDPLYAEVYSALSKVLEGLPIPTLSESARNKLIQIIYLLRKSVQDALPSIYSTIHSLESNRKFPFPAEVPSTSCPTELLSALSESNPLGLPSSLWNIPK